MTQWATVLGGMQKLALWGYWREAVTYMCVVIDLKELHAARSISDYARGVALRELANGHREDLERAKIWDQHHTPPDSAAVSEWEAFHNRMAKRIESEG